MSVAVRTLSEKQSNDGQQGSDQRSSSWIGCVVSFVEPVSSYNSNSDLLNTELFILDEELLDAVVSNNKSNFGKTAAITLKSINNWWPSTVASGDWVFVWMSDNAQDIDSIRKLLEQFTDLQSPNIGTKLCSHKSGLKFAGRILNIDSNDNTSQNGTRIVTQTLSCQAFLEFATSVYYTAMADSVANLIDTPSGSSEAATSPTGTKTVLLQGITDGLADIARRFEDKYKSQSQFFPDVIAGFYYAIIMGTDSNKTKSISIDNIPLTGHTIIKVPKQVAVILGNPTATDLWELIDVQLGLQTFDGEGSNWWEQFQPDLQGSGPIYQTPIRTKGFVPLYPLLWHNTSLWSILQQVQNDVCNEMYTALRVAGDGRIVPTLIFREKPFSTGLFNQLKADGQKLDHVNPNMTLKNLKAPSSQVAPILINAPKFNPDLDSPGNMSFSQPTAPSANEQLQKQDQDQKNNAAIVQGSVTGQTYINQINSHSRTLYGTLPRWQIDESIIKNYSISFRESARVNFVQVWGRSSGVELTGINVSPELFKQTQFLQGNIIADRKNIQRHGLRAVVINSQFDVFLGDETVSYSGLWAKMNADWLFNGELKANATLRINGQVDPICEGDNCQVGPILYHIESVQHNCNIVNGKKIFDTVLMLSNGLMAESFNQVNVGRAPLYPIHMSSDRKDQPGPGTTQVDIPTSSIFNTITGL